MYASLISLLFFSFICEANTFFEKSNVHLRATTKIELNSNLKRDQFITKPAGVWIDIAKISFLDFKGHVAEDCLLFRVPTNKKPGILKFVSNRKKKKCISLSQADSYAELGEIYNLKFELVKNKYTLFVDKKIVQYELLNLGSYEHKIFSNPIKATRFKGVLPLATVVYSKESISLLKDGKTCRKISDDCSVEFDNCNSCKKTWHEVINSKCQHKFSRVCGVDNCGEKGKSACIRGGRTINADPNLYCINDSPFGFCQKGLRVMCLNNELRCI